MDDAHFRSLIDAAYTNEKTRAEYQRRLNSLQRAVADTRIYDILTNPDVYYEKLRAAYESITTRKNLLTLVMALFREDEELRKTAADAYARWKKLHEDLARLQEARVRRSEPADKQVKKYTSFEEIEAKYDELARRGPHDTLRNSMKFLLLSFIKHIRPKRADLGALRVYTEKDPRHTDENYIVLRTKGSSFLVMNLYKTSKYYQTVEEDLPEGLTRDIRASLSRHPRDYIFQKSDGKPYSNSVYATYVRRTFEELFGRATGVSLLRHIYITEKLDFDDMTLEERDEEAKLMLHTAGLQQAYKWPKKTICPKLCAAYIQPTHRTRKIRRRRGHGASSQKESPTE